MNHDFPRILTLLRKEKGLSQKQVSTDLNISQALLSHYEKGVRECGLEFIVKVSDYYGVSCDYLLGRTPNKDGTRLNVEEVPDSAQDKDNKFRGSVIATLNKKLIVNSISIIFDLLQKINNKGLIAEVSSYIMVFIYGLFRRLYSANAKNPQGMFKLSDNTYELLSEATLCLSKLNIQQEIRNSGKTKNDAQSLKKLELSPDVISREYPLYASSLYSLIQASEGTISTKVEH